MSQKEAAESLLNELECCGDVGEVDILILLDSLACAGLRLETGQGEASGEYFQELVQN